MKIAIRLAEPGDLDAIMALEVAAFPEGIVEERGVFARRLEAFPEGLLVALEGNAICAYLSAEIWSGWKDLKSGGLARFELGHDPASWFDRQGETLYVSSMVVGLASRGQGVGRRLLQHGLALWGLEFPTLRRAVLLVNEHWTSARRIYGTLGFQEIGRLPAFFRPRRGLVGDAVVMTKETGRE